MELLGDVGHAESHFFRLETVLASVQDRCMVCAQNSFWMPSMVPLVDEAQVEACFGPFGHSANLDAR